MINKRIYDKGHLYVLFHLSLWKFCCFPLSSGTHQPDRKRRFVDVLMATQVVSVLKRNHTATEAQDKTKSNDCFRSCYAGLNTHISPSVPAEARLLYAAACLCFYPCSINI